jgi:outer membrane receptor protein involved in Fe transport
MRSFRNQAVLAAIFSFLFAAAIPQHLFAQVAGTASISGRVTDPSGAAVPNAAVTIQNTATAVAQAVTTDAQGRYSVPDLAIGPYQVTVAKSGFTNAVRSGITLTVGAAPVIDVQLAVGQAAQSVNVSAAAEQVQTTSDAVSSVVNQTQMRELPLNGRNFEQLILLAPGVSTYPAGGSSALTSVANAYSISGTRPEGYANLLDGEDVLNWWQRNAGGDVNGTSLGIEGIAEFQTLTNTYGAQYAGNGAAINAVSKSGTNEFHGSVYEFFRNSDLDSRAFFDGNSPPPFHRNQYGGALGGPIKKNKIFFFVNFEGIEQILDTTNPAFVPSAAMHQGIVYNGTNTPTTTAINPAAAAMLSMYPLPTTPTSNPDVGLINIIGTQASPESFGLGRVDWNISDKDSLFVRYEGDFGNRTTFGGPNSLDYWPTLDQTHNQFFTIGERHIFSPNLISQFTTSYSRPITGEVQPSDAPNNSLSLFTPTREDATISLPDGMAGLGAAFINPFNYLQNKFTNSENIDWIHGSHDIKFGLWERREDDNPYAYTFWNGWYLFASTLNFLQGNPLLFEGAPNGGTDANRYERTLSLEPYIQDDWKVNDRLTVNLGFRYEWESNPIEKNNNFYNLVGPPFGTGYTNVPHAFVSNPANHNFDPRVGLAWDVFGDHKTSLRAGFGIYHDVFQTYTFSSAYTSNPPFLTELQIYPFGYPCFPTPFAAACAADSIGGGLSQTNGTYYGTHQTPYTEEWNLNIQRELFKNTLLTVGYVGSRGVHLLSFHDFNPPTETTDANGVMHFATPNGVQNPRIDPALGSLDMTDTSSSSNYNALEVSVEHKLSSNFVMQFSYTWSHCLDYAYTYAGLGFNNQSSATENPYDYKSDYGNCSYDLRQNINASVVYVLPFRGNRWVEGWQLSGIQSWHTGVPFALDEGDQADLGNTFDTERPNVVAGCNVYANQSVNQWYNPACFFPSEYGTIGNEGRNNLVGPGFVETDAALMKTTRINERFSLQFRAELFNIFNHPNFAVPNLSVFNAGSFTTGFQATPNSTAGQITSLIGSGGIADVARQTQFSLKLIF